MRRIDPKYPYLLCQINSLLRIERAIAALAKKEGKENHPAAIVARENIEILEAMK